MKTLAMKIGLALLVWGLAGPTVDAQSPAAQRPTACDLLSDADLQGVQGEALQSRKPTETASGALLASQCFFQTARLEKSVSVMLVRSAGETATARQYWHEQFTEQPAAQPAASKKKGPPQKVEGVGEQAFWVGDRVSGSLYVLTGESFLRISVGGIKEEDKRLQSSVALARRALERLAPRVQAASR